MKTQTGEGDKKRPKVEEGSGLTDQQSLYSFHHSREQKAPVVYIQPTDPTLGSSSSFHSEPEYLPKGIHEMRIQDDGVSTDKH